ncbi:MAG: hypothetical protein ABL908_01260 [Hyphomicrobium sp.]
MTELLCDACKLPPMGGSSTPAPSGSDAASERALPPGWFVRRIDARTFTLCDCCGSMQHFKGGVSAYLQQQLGLGPYAVLAVDEGPGSGLHRHRIVRSE